MMKQLLLILIATMALQAQTGSTVYGNQTVTGSQSVGGMNNLGSGTALPGTCTVPSIFYLTTGTIGLYQCNSANTWSLPSGGGSAGIPLISFVPFFPNIVTGGVFANLGFAAGANGSAYFWNIGSGYTAASTDVSYGYRDVHFPAGYSGAPVVTLGWIAGNSAGNTNVQISFGVACSTTTADPTAMTYTTTNSNIVNQGTTTGPEPVLTATLAMPGGGCAGLDGWIKIGPRNNALSGSTGYIAVDKVLIQL